MRPPRGKRSTGAPPGGGVSSAPAPSPAFLGCGWAFPPTFNRPGASVAMASGDLDIRESLWILLSTSLGERTMLATYGCDLMSQVFSTLTTTAVNEIIALVTKAILDWEPRVTVENVSVNEIDMLEGWLNISIDYFVRQTNSRSNLVYPFYTREATLPPPPH
jgi:phage baseplate assembly protein W